MQKIALEEHFITSDFLQDTQRVDFDDLRIKAMDEAGIEISALSLTDPGIQGISDTNIAIELAYKTNDFLAERISKNPNRCAYMHSTVNL